MQAAYFYRPVYVSGGRWSFRVYITYTNHNHFYFPAAVSLPYHIAVGIIVRTITTAIIAVVTIIRTIPVRGVFGMISRTTPAAVQISVR